MKRNLSRLLYSLILCLVGSFMAYAQEKKVPKPLKIGENAPNVYLNNVYNYPGQRVQLKDFIKGKKLLIIDFWNRGCGACIDAMPKVESLQDRFGSDIQIIYVLSPTDSAYFEKLKSRIPNVRNLKLPNVIGDSLLYKHLFPHQGDPYQIWLGQDLNVIASSNQVELTAANIQDYLNAKLQNLPAKGADTYLYRYYNNSDLSILEMTGHASKDKMLNYSVITGPIKEFSNSTGSFLTDSEGRKIVGLRMLNHMVKELYERATYRSGMKEKYQSGGVFFKTKDSVHQDYNRENRDVSNYTYCYESYFKDGYNNERAYHKLRLDLDQYFNLRSGFEEIPTKCLVICIADSTKFKKLKSKFKEMHDKNGEVILKPQAFIPPSDKGFVIDGYTIHAIKFYLEKLYAKQYSERQIFVEVDRNFVHFAIDLKLTSRFEDFKSLQKELLQHGISLKEETRPMTFLVVRDAI